MVCTHGRLTWVYLFLPVSLARAIYSRAEVLLLDDVLSAVDAHTAHHLYQNALRGPLVKGRTVILVSHHVQLVTPGAGYIVSTLVFVFEQEVYMRCILGRFQ